MKKTFVVLLILAVAGGVFAQELTWSGEVQSGVKVLIPDGGKAIIHAYDDGDEGAETAVSASLDVTLNGGDWGLKFGLSSSYYDPSYDLPSLGVVSNAYGWINFLGGILNIKAGLIDDAAWAIGGEIDDNVSNGLGIRFEINPMEGFSLGFILDATYFYKESAPFGNKVGDYFASTGIGASYKADLFNVAVGFKLAPNFVKNWVESGNYPVPSHGGGNDVYKDTSYLTLMFGIGLNIIKNLDIYIDGIITNLGLYKNYGEFTLYEEVSYQVMDALKVGLVAGETLTGANGFEHLLIRPWAEYQVTDNISVGIKVPFDFDNTSDFIFESVGINPWVQYKVGGAFVKAGYGLDLGIDTSYADHEIYLLFGFSF